MNIGPKEMEREWPPLANLTAVRRHLALGYSWPMPTTMAKTVGRWLLPRTRHANQLLHAPEKGQTMRTEEETRGDRERGKYQRSATADDPSERRRPSKM